MAQFCAVTGAETDTAQQYLLATDCDLESAVELFFSSGGVTASNQMLAEAPVRERIEGTTDRLLDPELHVRPEMLMPRRTAPPRPVGVFNQTRDMNIGESMSPHERRLAELFRPPFDIITDMNLDEAKKEAQEANKWVLVNVQDVSNFDCQRLNRDIWSHESIKEIILQNFVFLQFTDTSDEAQTYRVMYPIDHFPHIAILDPWTGEQMMRWTKVPEVSQFLEQIVEFLVAHKVDESPSRGTANTVDEVKFEAHIVKNGSSDDLDRDPLDKESEHAANLQNSGSEIVSIVPADIPEPEAGPDATRIQIRLGDGKRLVRRFALTSKVNDIYAYVKMVAGTNEPTLTLASERRDLVSFLGQTIKEADLMNCTILVNAR